MNKTLNVILFPALLILMGISFRIFPKIDPYKNRYREFFPVYSFICNLIMTSILLLYFFTGIYNLGYPIKINIVVPIIIGLLMIVIGSLMNKLKRNFMIGARTPWAITSENVWNKTQKFAGRMFIVLGIIIIITPFLGMFWGGITFIAGILLTTLGTYIYSYLEFKKENKNK